MKHILVISHARSGNHLIIDSMRKNFNHTNFLVHRPSFSTVENLFLPHDHKVTDAFYDFTFNNQNDGINIYKTHLLPEEFEKALSTPNFFSNPKDKEIVQFLYEKAEKVFIHRDVHDAMTSWFIFCKKGGGLHLLTKERIAAADLSEFIRLPNFWIMPCRGFEQYDQNLITYWAYHTMVWKKQKDVYITSFLDWKKEYVENVQKFSDHFHLENFLIKPIEEPELQIASNNRYIEFVKIRFLYKIFPPRFFSTAVTPHKGVVGEYKKHMSDPEKDETFISEMVNKYFKY